MDVRPDLAAEFDQQANSVRLSSLALASTLRVAWICKNCGNKWQAKVQNRSQAGTGCPSPDCRARLRMLKNRKSSKAQFLGE